MSSPNTQERGGVEAGGGGRGSPTRYEAHGTPHSPGALARMTAEIECVEKSPTANPRNQCPPGTGFAPPVVSNSPESALLSALLFRPSCVAEGAICLLFGGTLPSRLGHGPA